MRLFSIVLASLAGLYSSLDPTSVSQHFAFYELYPNTMEGRSALKTAWQLLSKGAYQQDPAMVLPTLDPSLIISFVNKGPNEAFGVLNDEELLVIENLSEHLWNRKLKGFHVWDQKQLYELSDQDMDLARGLLLVELGDDPKKEMKIRSYEAAIDLMALQIQARLEENATGEEVIRAMNDYVFSEMRFRFPPHSLHAKDIDLYTFLPSVLDSRRGVCLGVSILYLCIAQRLGIDLEVITPPGHIYVRYVNPEGKILNIETTARGIDVPSERYLGIETKSLQTRTIKEVIGLAFMNQAAVSWHRENPQEAIELYEKAEPFLKDDYLLDMFLGFNYLFVGREKEGRARLEKIDGKIPDYSITKDSITEDYLKKKADPSCIQAVYKQVDESRKSVLQKQKELKAIVKKFPNFRQGFYHLAITHLQLGKEKDALPILEKYSQMNPEDPTAQYYIAAIYFQRHHYKAAWNFLKKAEGIVLKHNHKPRALKELRLALKRACPEP